MRKILSGIMVIIMTVVAFAGCSPKKVENVAGNSAAQSDVPSYMNETGYPIAKDKITLKMMGPKGAIQVDWKDMELMKRMEKLTNISFEFDTPLSTAYIERKNLVFASNDLPDVFYGGPLTLTDEETYGTQGMLISLEKYIDKYAPSLKKKLDQRSEIKKAITASDGHVYTLPYVVDTKTMAAAVLYINMDWLKNVGLGKPQTVDEFYNVLKAFKEKDPNKNGKADEIPLSYWKQVSSSAGIPGILHITIFNAFSGQGGGLGFDIRNNKIVFNPYEPYFKEYLAYMNKLYAEGLFDKEMFTQSQQQYIAKYKEGTMGISTITLSSVLTPGQPAPYEILAPMTSSISTKKAAPALNTINTGYFALSNKCKYPEAMVRWADVFFKEVDENVEGICGLSNFLGIYKYNWDFSDSSRKTYKRESKVEGMTPVDYINKQVFPTGFGWVVTGAVPDTDPLLLLKATESEKQYFPYIVPGYPSTVRLSKAESDRAAFLQNDIYTYIEQMMVKFIIGDESLDKWDTYISTLKKMNIEELIKIKQDAYDRWNKTK